VIFPENGVRFQITWCQLSGRSDEPAMSHQTQAPEYQEADRAGAQRQMVPAPRARQGVIGHNVRYVLGFGLAAVVVAFVIVYLIYVG
jgi:hypothetical protein